MFYVTTRLVESIKQEFHINLSKPYGAFYVTQMNSVFRAPWLAGAKVINEQQEFNFRPFSRTSIYFQGKVKGEVVLRASRAFLAAVYPSLRGMRRLGVWLLYLPTLSKSSPSKSTTQATQATTQ